MKGIDIARQFYLEHGAKMINAGFSDYAHRIAVGLVGHGSECFGYDDDISLDHDFTQGFAMWLTRDDEERIGYRLQRAYDALKRDVFGKDIARKSVGGYSADGVHIIDDFYKRYTGANGAPASDKDWLYTESFYFAEATNGEVFRDDLGKFSEIRNTIMNGMPRDVRLKRMASCALKMAQSGQYNYPRILEHKEMGAAMLALTQFVDSASEMIFLLNGAHRPYYKWSFRAMRDLTILSDMCAPLEFLLTADNDNATLITKQAIVEDISLAIANELRAQNLANVEGNYLEPFAYALNKSIKSSAIRDLHILSV